MQLPDVIAVDFETIEILLDGTTRGSTEMYRPNFRVDSAAFTERRDGEMVSWFVQGEGNVREELLKLGQRPVVVHNFLYEYAVTKCRYPDIELNWHADTMRLVQVYDNGGGDNAFERIILDPVDFDEAELEAEENIKYRPLSGFGLSISCKRILGYEDHKKEAHDWILANVPGVKKSQAGGHLDKLPPDILKRYNELDTERTLELYEHCTFKFLEEDYDWTFDHGLYFNTTKLIAESKIRGVLVDRDYVLQSAEAVVKEITEIEREFKEKFTKEIAAVERLTLLKHVRSRKTMRGRKNFVRKMRTNSDKWAEEIAFKIGSNKQLEALFIGQLGIEPKFFTAKGSPAFKNTMLGQWGEGGLMLGTRRKRLLVLKQLCNLYKATEYDSRFHVDLKAAGTSTGRAAGGHNQ